MSKLYEIVQAAERNAIAAALESHDGNVSRAAASLGVERTNFHKRMRKHGLRGQGAEGQRRRAGDSHTPYQELSCVEPDRMHGAADGAPGSDF